MLNPHIKHVNGANFKTQLCLTSQNDHYNHVTKVFVVVRLTISQEQAQIRTKPCLKRTKISLNWSKSCVNENAISLML